VLGGEEGVRMGTNKYHGDGDDDDETGESGDDEL
jgi:hypothetical protein